MLTTPYEAEQEQNAKLEQMIDLVIRDVAELPYSPDSDDDQVMRVTADELRSILRNRAPERQGD